MRTLGRLVVAAFFVVSAGVEPSFAQASERDEARIRWVIDGDTVELSTGHRVRLIGIDAPEHRPWEGRVDFYGREATLFAISMLRGRKVFLEYDRLKNDRYGRTLAYLYLEDGTFVNERLVHLGYARARFYPPNDRHKRQLEEAERLARQGRRGLWASPP